ncbi:hypothetical protein M9458_034196, partial [Cirrhinus mrigala]
AFNAKVTADSNVVVVGFRNLNEILPKYNKSDKLETTIVSVTTANNAIKSNSTSVELTFDYGEKRIRNHEMGVNGAVHKIQSCAHANTTLRSPY